MRRIQKKIIKLFLITIVSLNAVNAVIDGLFEFWLREHPDWSWSFIGVGTINILVSLIWVGLVTLFFIKQLDKFIEKEIQNQLDQQDLLYSSIAHDLKTPMTSIKGYVQAFEDKKIAPGEAPRIYQIITGKVNLINQLLNNLLELSRLSSSSYSPPFQQKDMVEVVRQVLIDNYECIEKGQGELNTCLPERTVEVSMVEIDIKRALTNLIMNACKHNAPGVKIEVGMRELDSKIQVYVADDGIAIDPSIRDRLFDSFMTGDEHRRTGRGYGLGLAIVKQIVENHQGRIILEDGPGDYTKAFILEFEQ